MAVNGTETTKPAADAAPGLLKAMGPGLITGASDDDPSGIATYSQAGAQFGYQLTWSLLFCYPLMVAIQEICGRIGRVTGIGIAGNLRLHYPSGLLKAIVGLLLVANIINIGADLGAMAAALQLLVGGPLIPYVLLFAAVSTLLEVFVSYARYVAILKWMTLSLLAYVATVFVIDVPWGSVALATFVPHLSIKADYIVALVAVLGTTISPYLFFWQAQEEAEDTQEDPACQPLCRSPEEAPRQLRRIRIDTWVGMAVSNLVALFIVVATATTLHAHGVTDIQTSAQAAEALRPIAGPFAFVIFALGIIGTGLLALPVLAGSAAYAVGEARHWPVGLARKPREAKAFYGTLALAVAAGCVMNLLSIDPIKALFWAAVLNGVIAVPVMVLIMRMAVRADIMGAFTLPRGLRLFGWLTVLVMAASVIAMAVTSF